MTETDSSKEVVRALKKNQKRIDEVFIACPPFSDSNSDEVFSFGLTCPLNFHEKTPDYQDKESDKDDVLSCKVHLRGKIVGSSENAVFPGKNQVDHA